MLDALAGMTVPTHRNDLQVLQLTRLDQVGLSFNLALDIIPQAELSGTISSRDQLVKFCNRQLQLCPQGHDANRVLYLNNLANALFARFELSGMILDLDEAIGHHREILCLSKDHGDQSRSLNNLAHCLYTRFKRLGMLANLWEAINLHRKALELRPLNHPDRPTTLNNLALCLSSLYDQQGVSFDLNDAISLLQEAVALLPDDDPNRSFALLNLGDCLYTRFQSTGDLQSLHDAIALHEHSVPGPDSPARPYASSSLARTLFTRFKTLRNMEDLEMAIHLERDTIPHCLHGHSVRPKSLHNLGECLLSRFGLFNEVPDLDEAIKHHREALALRPLRHPDRSTSLSSLAKCLLVRSDKNRRSAQTDKREAFALFSKLMEISQSVQAVFIQDVYAARDWVSAAEQTNHRTTISAYQTLFQLLVNHLATLPSLTQYFCQLKKIMSCHAMDAFSACLRHDSPADAVELLEQGRAVFWGLLSRLRSPLDDVVAFGDRGKQLAKEFMELASPLRHASQHDIAWGLNIQLEDVLSRIRGLPGLSRFLLPPLFSDPQQAATRGPVIIVNASQYGCDGLVVLHDQDPIHVPLQISKSEVEKMSQQIYDLLAEESHSRESRIGQAHYSIFSSRHAVSSLTVMLRRLWTGVVSPIVKVLEEFLPHESRIWWCPTSDFVLLPLHAAGPYERWEPDPGLPDLYVSSYTLTLSTLACARQIQPPDSIGLPRFLAVTVGCSPNAPFIPGVYKELESIKRQIPPHASLLCLTDTDAAVSKVVEELKRNQFVHFACHGLSNRASPFKSALLMGEGNLLKIRDIMPLEMSDPRFAYLSACSTTVGDAESPDESIHLAAVMQFTGFRSVVGTIWAVIDRDAAKIVRHFYENMMDGSGQLDHTQAAFALHASLKNANIPFGQRILYVHLGA